MGSSQNYGPPFGLYSGTYHLGVPKWDPNFGNYPNTYNDSLSCHQALEDGSQLRFLLLKALLCVSG